MAPILTLLFCNQTTASQTFATETMFIVRKCVALTKNSKHDMNFLGNFDEAYRIGVGDDGKAMSMSLRNSGNYVPGPMQKWVFPTANAREAFTQSIRLELSKVFPESIFSIEGDVKASQSRVRLGVAESVSGRQTIGNKFYVHVDYSTGRLIALGFTKRYSLLPLPDLKKFSKESGGMKAFLKGKVPQYQFERWEPYASVFPDVPNADYDYKLALVHYVAIENPRGSELIGVRTDGKRSGVMNSMVIKGRVSDAKPIQN